MLDSVEKYDNVITYKRKSKKMSRNKKTIDKIEKEVSQNTLANITPNEELLNRITNIENQINDINIQEKGKNKVIKKVVSIVGLIVGYIVVPLCVTAVLEIIVPIAKHTENIEEIRSDILKIDERIEQMNDTIDKSIEQMDNELKELIKVVYLNISEKNDHDMYAISIKFNNDNIPKTTLANNDNMLSAPNWTDSDMKIASLLQNNNIEYTVKELQNRPFVTMYYENGSEVYFSGKYNENNHWDGECILNVYRDNELMIVFEGTYDDGELKKFKRIACDDSAKWTVANRVVFAEYTDGETWDYTKTKSFSQGINSDDFEEKQILKVDQILNSIDEKVESYYKGRISQNRYNDQTGNAVRVKYKENGDVRFLYVGGMKNGYPYDNTGNAWSISWGNADDGYYYYKGNVVDGNNVEIPQNWSPMTQEEIKEKIESENFDCSLQGLINSN